MFKTLTFLKRKPGMSLDDFRAYYETHHRKIGEQVLKRAQRYVRRYVSPLEEGKPEPDFDVITEVWFADRADYEAQMAELDVPDIIAMIVEDEEKLFDRSCYRLMCVDEVESDMTTVQAKP